MQGNSLVPILKGESPNWRDALYYHYYEYPGAHNVQKHEGIRTEQYKLIHYYEIDEWELFDFENDPDEMQNLYANPKYAKIENALKQKLVTLKLEYKVPK
jgi:arylsulfatase A-like enzyme